LIRGVEVNKALDILKFTPNDGASEELKNLLLSAIANWQAKNEGVRIEESNLFVKEIFVDQGRTLKRLRLLLRDVVTELGKDQIMLPLFLIAKLLMKLKQIINRWDKKLIRFQTV
jgi:hypothetical protein